MFVQHCREQYPRPVRLALWLIAECAIIGSDMQEVRSAVQWMHARTRVLTPQPSSSGSCVLKKCPHPTPLHACTHVSTVGCLQVIGTAIALLLLSRGAVPLWGGVLLAAAGAYAVLLLERVGVRYLEGVFEFLIAGGFGGDGVRGQRGSLRCIHPIRVFIHCTLPPPPPPRPAPAPAVMSVSMGFLFFSADIPYADVLRGG